MVGVAYFITGFIVCCFIGVIIVFLFEKNDGVENRKKEIQESKDMLENYYGIMRMAEVEQYVTNNPWSSETHIRYYRYIDGAHFDDELDLERLKETIKDIEKDFNFIPGIGYNYRERALKELLGTRKNENFTTS